MWILKNIYITLTLFAELLKEMKQLYPTVGEKAKVTFIKLNTRHEKNIYDAKIVAYCLSSYTILLKLK